MSQTIHIAHVARVEGHGGIKVVLHGDEIERIEFNIFEGIRLFEGLVRGRGVREVPAIVSRICAICSHNHAITACFALERALGIEVTEQARRLRDLAFQGANIQSHALHAFVLALPDFVGQPSVIGMAATHPELVRIALRLKKLGNTVQEVTGGRAVHPVNYVLGGFGRLPDIEDLARLREMLLSGLDDCRRALDLLEGVKVPDFLEEPLEFGALVPDGDAFFFGDVIAHSSGARLPVAQYKAFTNEVVVAHSHAKHSRFDGRPYMVGALARLALNGERVGGLAREAAERLGLSFPARNVLMNSVAQVVEMVFSIERALEIVEGFLRDGLSEEEPVRFEVRPGYGVAATEVPRGTLYHAYEVDGRGLVVGADVITPTAQNLAHAEEQFRAVVRSARGLEGHEIARRLEMVARAYDPCISCSVHVVRV